MWIRVCSPYKMTSTYNRRERMIISLKITFKLKDPPVLLHLWQREDARLALARKAQLWSRFAAQLGLTGWALLKKWAIPNRTSSRLQRLSIKSLERNFTGRVGQGDWTRRTNRRRTKIKINFEDQRRSGTIAR